MAGNMEKWAKKHQQFREQWFRPPVNVQELDDAYEIFLVAPGWTKKDFQIALSDNILTISVEKKQEEEIEEGASWRRREFVPKSFQRKFELNEKVDMEAIKAKYENGILQLTLPKLEGSETFRKDIFVS